MASEEPILAQVVITEVTSPGFYYQGDLPNGKSINVHAPSGRKGALELNVGDVVTVEMTPYDFSKGRIRENVEESANNS